MKFNQGYIKLILQIYGSHWLTPRRLRRHRRPSRFLQTRNHGSQGQNHVAI
jgi:hypothetical protein